MLRILAVHRATTSLVFCGPLTRLQGRHLVRFNSGNAGDDALKEARKRQDDMQRDWDARKLTYADVKLKAQSPKLDAYLIDVREPDEVIQGCIPSSVNLPLSVLSGALHLSPKVFRKTYGFEKPEKEQEIVFYCRTGKRSATACDVAKRNGFTNLYNYEGSWVDWIGNETEKK